MGAYMYPIVIKRKAQIIRFSEDVKADCYNLTAEFIKKVVPKDAYFRVDNDRQCIIIYQKRLETAEEVTARVLKEESYMNEYNKRKKVKTV